MLNADGWDAIAEVLDQRFGGGRVEWHAALPYRPLGPMPVGDRVTNSIAAYVRPEPVLHWLMIGYALTAPFEERGYEFTMRVPRKPGDPRPPVWAMDHMETLASYVSRGGHDLAPGDHVELPDPLDPERPYSEIRAGGFVPDPELGRVATRLGEVLFLQFVGITLAELEAARSWGMDGLLAVLGPRLPIFVTDLGRGSLVNDAEVARAVRRGP